MAMEVVATIVGKVWDCLFEATCRQFGYLYQTKDSVERLSNKAEKLADMRERVQGKIDEATTKGEIILRDVRKWVEKVDDITAEAEDFIEAGEVNKRCLKGLCIDPWSRYKVGKEAQRKIEAILILQEEGGFETVSRRAPPPPEIVTSSASSITFQSREFIRKGIMESLKDEDVSIIGICGMGGVGKTTIVNEISKQAIEEDLIDTVAIAVVSQTQSYVKIQGEIASMLGFTPPDHDDESARARFLWHKIKEKRKLKSKKEEEQEEEELVRFLIILDDVWEGIDLDRIGIPYGNNRKGCKIVLTSRIEDVCIEMKAKTFTIETLSKEESWRLFSDVAGEIVDDADINSIAEEVADECCGLPIAIVTVAGALKNRNNKYVWIDAKNQLQKSALTHIKGMHQKVFASLELSYNYLANEEGKSVFLLCCSFSEDFKIPIELLMRYGMGLSLFQEVYTVEEARARTHAVVSTLTASFLLITGHDKNYVKMHDVVRDVAIKLSKDKNIFMVKAGLGQREWPSAETNKNFTGLSLMSNDIREVPDGLQCPKLQALLLQGNSSLVISNNFFQGMKDLKVLDMSYIEKLPLPPSLIFLANLTTLCLNNCKFGEAGISLIGKLTNLEILSLKRTDIAEIPNDFEQLVKLRFYDSTQCFNLKHIPEGVISSLKKLEELYISNKDEDLFVELEALSRQTTLYIRTGKAGLGNMLGHVILSNHMPFQNLTSVVIAIGSGNTLISAEKYPSCSRILYISSIHFQLVDWSYQLPTKITEVLHLCNVVGLRSILPDLGDHGFNDLKILRLSYCREIESLFNMLLCKPCRVFNNLESLYMECIPNMVEMCHGPLPAESFCKLKRMEISNCHNLSNIVPNQMLQRLNSLEIFEACNCNSVVYAFDFERLVIAIAETKFLSSLNDLQLDGLPEMTQIWNGDTELISLSSLKTMSVYNCSKLRQVFPSALLHSLISLQHMEIKDCNSLEEIFGKEEEEEDEENEIIALKIDHTTTSPSLGNLTSIRIWGCNKLEKIFTPSIVKVLVQLRILEVRFCIKMEEIVSDKKEETGASTERIMFPSLYKIDLEGLDSLACFCAGRCTIEFPALQLLDIQDCMKMETFGFGDQVTPKLNMIHLQRKKQWMDNLNITMRQFFKEKQDHMQRR